MNKDAEHISSPKVFEHGRLKMHFAKWGHGPNVLLVFHGFSLSHIDMVRFTSHWNDQFTCYGFDLPYHGANDQNWSDTNITPLTSSEFAGYFKAFSQSIEADKFSILGYSLGGRMALKISELLPQQVSNLYLFAPDGLEKSKWYIMFNHTIIGRWAFRFFIKNNKPFFKLLSGFRKSGLISANLLKFVKANTENHDMQWRVYFVWTYLRKLDPIWSDLVTEWKNHPTTIDVFFGIRDYVIPPSHGKRLERDYPEANIHILDSGHVILTNKIADFIMENNLMRLPSDKKES